MNAQPVAISMQGAGKRYTRFIDKPMLITAAIRFGTRTKVESFWAVRGMDLELRRGDCLGVIGRNGAGKSTMLRMLAGVTSPTEGTVAIRGRVAPLVSVGVGFHPELTGRENVYVNGAILGLRRREVDERLESILDFAEIGHFLDTPVKFYSSGMFVRLGFAVAVHARPDILLVDEVLAVGDIAFQTKCFRKMLEIADSGATIAVVSHNLTAIRMLCTRTIVLERGEKRFDGDTETAISHYYEMMEAQPDPDSELLKENLTFEPGVVEIDTFELVGDGDRPTGRLGAGDPLRLRVRARFLKAVENPVFNVLLSNGANGVLVYKEPTYPSNTGSFPAGSVAEIDITMPANLPTGTFVARTMIQDSELSRYYARAMPVTFYVAGRMLVGGAADLRARFDVRQLSLEPPAQR